MMSKIYAHIIRLAKKHSRKGIYEFLESEYKNIKPSENVLTVGSGGRVNELLASASKTNNFTVTSFDIDPDRNPDIVGDLCLYDFSEKKYDAIILCEVLEHLHSPHIAIENLTTALNPGGCVIITVPFIFPIHDRPYDYFRYTRYGLEFLLKDFTDVSITERNNWVETIVVLFTRHSMEKTLSSRLAAPIFLLVTFLSFPLLYLMAKCIPTNFITTGYLAKARKK